MANYVSYSDLSTVVTKINNKFKTLDGAYVIKGSKTFAQLPDLSTATASMIGYVYNISEQFTTTADFVEGTGKIYSAGTNVVIVNTAAAEETPVFKFDVLSNFVDVQAIEDSIDGVEDELIDMVGASEFDATQAYPAGSIVLKDGVLYKFTTAHTANDPWDANEVSAVNILTLISTAEPESLTNQQLEDVLGLLD